MRSLNVLNDARISSLKARGNENLTLVSRGAETAEVGGEAQDKFDVAYRTQMKQLGGADSGLLGRAAASPATPAGKNPVEAAAKNVAVWKDRHKAARDSDDAGNYKGALAKVIGAKSDEPTGECFDNVDAALEAR